MSLKIAYYVHGRGRGHSSRALSVINKLILRKYKLKLLAGRDAYPVLYQEFEVTAINSIFPDSSFFDFTRRLRSDLKLLRHFRPDVLISDGDAPSTWAAKLLGIPIICIGHGLVFPYCKHVIKLPWWGSVKENFKVRVASFWADYKFILHFCLLPTTDDRSIVVKPDLKIESQPLPQGDYLISYFRDGNGLAALKKLTAFGIEIRNFGHPVNIAGIQNYKADNTLFKQMLSGARGVIGSAGSNLIFESMAMRKPMFLLYHPKDFEQKANAAYMEHLGIGLSSAFDSVSDDLVQKYGLSLAHELNSQNPLHVMPSLSDEIIDCLQVNFQ